MDSPTRSLVRRALDELKPYLATYVTHALGESRGARRLERGDMQALLGAMVEHWEGVFARKLTPTVRHYVFELKDVRNRWAHEEAFDADEAERAAHTTRMVAKAIGAPKGVLDALAKLGGGATTEPAPITVPAAQANATRVRPHAPVQVRAGTSTPGPDAGGRPMSQRDMMRRLFALHAPDDERVIREYAAAERSGAVARASNPHGMAAEDYARALLNDGRRKGWLAGDEASTKRDR